ncbi:MAG TPA: hypothetical protein VJ608_02070, partial [Albitalea sp.]|nr:hypothetical protein [Albitalea sp.]
MRPSTPNTFRLWTLLLALFISACQTSGTTDKPAAYPPPALSHPALTPLFDDLEQRSFNFFWDTANPPNGLVPDRYPNPP